MTVSENAQIREALTTILAFASAAQPFDLAAVRQRAARRTRRRAAAAIAGSALSVTGIFAAVAILLPPEHSGSAAVRIPLPRGHSGAASPPQPGHDVADPAVSRLAALAREEAEREGATAARATAVLTSERGAELVSGAGVPPGHPRVWVLQVETARPFMCRVCKGNFRRVPMFRYINVAYDARSWAELGNGIGPSPAIDLAELGRPVVVLAQP